MKKRIQFFELSIKFSTIEPWRLILEPSRLTMEPWRVCKPMVWLQFVTLMRIWVCIKVRKSDLGPHHIEKSYPDPHPTSSEKTDPDLEMMRIRNSDCRHWLHAATFFFKAFFIHDIYLLVVSLFMQLLTIDLSYIYQDYSCPVLGVISKSSEERLESGSCKY
jgi:hypothetical protein